MMETSCQGVYASLAQLLLTLLELQISVGESHLWQFP
jgi:hypothetical protein